MMKSYKSSFVQWLGYLALTEETGVQFPYGENIFCDITLAIGCCAPSPK